MRSFKQYTEQILRMLRTLLFPRRCIGCGKPMTESTASSLCDACMASYRRARAVVCPKCGQQILLCRCVRIGEQEVPLYSLLPYRPKNAQSNRSDAEYDAVSRMILYRKERVDAALEDFLAGQMAALCACVIAEQSAIAEYSAVDGAQWIITYPPRSQKKRQEIGHDQSEQLAKRLSHLTGVPMLVCLERIRGADTAQKTLGAKERSENAHESYALSNRSAGDILGKHILLIDDIATTGATLSVCASILTEAGANTVIAVTLARTVHDEIG
jgi:ComF family protein